MSEHSLKIPRRPAPCQDNYFTAVSFEIKTNEINKFY